MYKRPYVRLHHDLINGALVEFQDILGLRKRKSRTQSVVTIVRLHEERRSEIKFPCRAQWCICEATWRCCIGKLQGAVLFWPHLLSIAAEHRIHKLDAMGQSCRDDVAGPAWGGEQQWSGRQLLLFVIQSGYQKENSSTLKKTTRVHYLNRMRWSFRIYGTSELSLWCTFTVSYARVQRWAFGSSCRGRASCRSGPIRCSPGRTGWEVGWEGKNERKKGRGGGVKGWTLQKADYKTSACWVSRRRASSPVGKGLKGCVHVARVSDVFHPSQACNQWSGGKMLILIRHQLERYLIWFQECFNGQQQPLRWLLQ